MYREAKIQVKTADDGSLKQGLQDLSAWFYQTKDLESFSTTVRVGASDSETTIAIAPVTTGYFLVLLSDYPVRVRLNGASETQYTLMSNGIPATVVGAPAPYQCAFVMTGTVMSVCLQPISGAAQTANCKIIVTGDPTSSYT